MRKMTVQETKGVVAGRTWRCACGYKTNSFAKLWWHCGKAVRFWKHYPMY